MSTYTLYGADNSHFTGKVKAYLRYKGIAHRDVQVTLWTYQRVLLPRTGVRFIPVLRTPEDEFIQDSSVIIETLEQRFPERAVCPQTPKQRLANLLLELYADEWFLLPGMHYRWTYQSFHNDALMRDFGRVAGPLVPRPLRRMIARRLSRPFRGARAPLGITLRTIPAIEAWFLAFLEHFEAHLEQQPYLFGSRPSLADFALAGPLTAHTWRDPYSRRILERHAPRTIDWIERINAPEQPAGEFLADDEIPATLLPILQHLFAEQWPILLDTASYLPQWLQEHPGKAHVSRALGWHDFSIGDVRDKRLMFSNAVWMMQRPLDCYRATPSESREAVDAWLRDCGGLEAMQFEMPRRLERRDNRLVAV